MKTRHIVAPRTGPQNAGDRTCTKCGLTVFTEDGSLAYDTDQAGHTTDQSIIDAINADEMPDWQACA